MAKPSFCINIMRTDIYENDIRHRVRAFFPQISHRAKIGCAKYDLSTGEGVAMEQWYLNMGEVPGTPLSQIVGIYSNVKPEDRECLKTSLSRLVHGETDHDQREPGSRMARDGNGFVWI